MYDVQASFSRGSILAFFIAVRTIFSLSTIFLRIENYPDYNIA